MAKKINLLFVFVILSVNFVLAKNIDNLINTNIEKTQVINSGDAKKTKSSPPADAQVVTIKVEPKKPIRISLRATQVNTKIWLEYKTGEFIEMTIDDTWSDAQNYSSDEGTIKFYGDLTGIDCTGNYSKLTALDVSKNTKLTHIVCSKNSLTKLDISKNTDLEILTCYNNKLTELDVSNNTKLKDLSVPNNKISTIDLPKNADLETIIVYGNNLTYLDFSNNTNLRAVYMWANNFDACSLNSMYETLPNRTSMSLKGKIYVKNKGEADSEISGSKTSTATAKNWGVWDYNGTTSEDEATLIAINGTGTACDMTSKAVINLTVKKDSTIKVNFKATEDSTRILIETKPNVYISEIVNKTWTAIKKYSTSGTNIKIYGKLSNFNCSDNNGNIENLDISKNNNLTYLACYKNKLKNIDISKNTALTVLDCFGNKLSNININNNLELTELNCNDNELIALKTEKNVKLSVLNCKNNAIASLDISKNTALKQLYCDSNKLNALYITTNTKLEIINCSQNSIADVDFSKSTLLTSIKCSENKLKSIDVSKNKELKLLHCYSNEIETLDVENNTKLVNFSCSNNKIKELDFSKNSSIYWLYCSNNELVTLKLNSDADLKYIVVWGNQLDACTLNAIYASLNERSSSDIGMMYVKNKTLTNKGVSTSRTSTAVSKNWKILDFNENNTPIEVVGDGSGCKSNIENSSYDTENIKIYPNPATNLFSIEAPVDTDIKIYDVKGRLMQSKIMETNKDDFNINKMGTYIIEMKNKKFILREKIIITSF